MDNIKEYIGSGILELYVLGVTSAEENEQVGKMASLHTEILKEIDNISIALEGYGQQQAVAPDPTIKPFLMAMMDYNERLANGEQHGFPPLLHEGSAVSDYAEWINRQDIYLPGDFKDFYAKIIGYSPEVTTAIVWIKDGAPEETHTHELEKFLILEGACDITIEDEIHHLVAGGFLSIPLCKKHNVRITSSIACKLILQRIAA
jgi:mannose-6-phosphate isomerase-like protein (cupin superfamily)